MRAIPNYASAISGRGNSLSIKVVSVFKVFLYRRGIAELLPAVARPRAMDHEPPAVWRALARLIVAIVAYVVMPTMVL